MTPAETAAEAPAAIAAEETGVETVVPADQAAALAEVQYEDVWRPAVIIVRATNAAKVAMNTAAATAAQANVRIRAAFHPTTPVAGEGAAPRRERKPWATRPQANSSTGAIAIETATGRTTATSAKAATVRNMRNVTKDAAMISAATAAIVVTAAATKSATSRAPSRPLRRAANRPQRPTRRLLRFWTLRSQLEQARRDKS